MKDYKRLTFKRLVDPLTHGCDKEYCFYPEICETNRVCLECKHCIYANLIKEEIDKKEELCKSTE